MTDWSCPVSLFPAKVEQADRALTLNTYLFPSPCSIMCIEHVFSGDFHCACVWAIVQCVGALCVD